MAYGFALAKLRKVHVYSVEASTCLHRLHSGPRVPSTRDTVFAQRASTRDDNIEASGNDCDSPQARLERLRSYEPLLFFSPLLNAALAYYLYIPTRDAFHALVNDISRDFFVMDALTSTDGTSIEGSVDTISDLVNPVLNGPVTTSIAILLGTLIATTISISVDRNKEIQRLLIGLTEEVKVARWFVNSFPEPYRTDATNLLTSFMMESVKDFRCNNVTPHTIRSKQQLGQVVLLVNKMVKDESMSSQQLGSAATGEVYGAISQLMTTRGNLITAIQTKFPFFHYANLGTLAITLCLIFLTETFDSTQQLEQDSSPLHGALMTVADNQLALAWSMLIGTFSMLFVVVYDLNFPLTGMQRTMGMSNYDIAQVEAYAFDFMDCGNFKEKK